jgi:type IV secretory pathway ATPase VirB11/archaellum biosynthesis ATPase
MPLFDHLRNDNPDDGSDNGHRQESQPPADISPIVPGRAGRPSYSLEALREQIERQFQEETAHRADILLDLDTESKRRDMLREVMDYVIGLQAVTLSAQDKSTLLDKAYNNLFSFGPLDAFLRDDAITEITVNGPYEVHVRRGMGALEKTRAAFDDRAHLAAILARVVAMGGAVFSDTAPFLEVGVVLLGRATRISLIGPPVSPDYSLEIRLHPRQPVLLDDLYARFHAVPPQMAALLKAILAGGHGLLIVGDVGLGKTTLAGALAHTLSSDAIIFAVERATEMHLPPHITRRTAIPPTPEDTRVDFVAQIQAALDEAPQWLIVDEIRGDESAAVWAALTRPDAPRYLWIFRGDSQPDRLRSALSMVIRKRHPAVEQAAINRALAEHLPFMAAYKMIEGTPRLHLVAEAILDDATDEAALVFRPLLSEQDGGWLVAENRPVRALDLSDDFWE